ncbi:hypothetical protein GF339_14775 [candidate division KSB3 bacterium]|uniref:Uncharacterized protein n=1 Tax=candidate division KSB3 bacterium TaxID=2044937 RepID=A0A9D5JWZ8_9BACT|nr:hypothetical protein [candidate division KSB3 bacterium]MBD3325847.1 hypothetical protein [candidate division KSB3 bacterium]
MMAFPDREEYERLLYALPDQYPDIQTSTVRLYTNSPTSCIIRGRITFRNGLELQVFEYLDCSDGDLLAYFYAIFQAEERIRWYDLQPQPHNADLAPTFPHHLHTPPDIKHNRHPAPGISFTALNLPTLITECLTLVP